MPASTFNDSYWTQEWQFSTIAQILDLRSVKVNSARGSVPKTLSSPLKLCYEIPWPFNTFIPVILFVSKESAAVSSSWFVARKASGDRRLQAAQSVRKLSQANPEQSGHNRLISTVLRLLTSRKRGCAPKVKESQTVAGYYRWAWRYSLWWP